MSIGELKLLFREELRYIYSPSEVSKLFSVFCEEISKINAVQIRKNPAGEISAIEKKAFLEALHSLKKGIPYQYVLGYSEFFGMKFFVDHSVLIPRPETEELVELALNKIKTLKKENLKILDIGTGSGCIAITLAKMYSKCKVSAIDISESALSIAKKNRDLHNVDVDFSRKDFLKEPIDRLYDILISNPPYISMNEMNEISNSVKDFEPHQALFAPEEDALIFYRKICDLSDKLLKQGGFFFLEINQKFGEETLNLFVKKFKKTFLQKDLSGNDRFILGSK